MPASPEATRQAYRIASWTTAGLAFVAAVLTFAFGLAAVTGPGATPAGDGQQVTAGPGPSANPGTVLARDQSVVSGVLTRVVGTRVEGAPPLVIPLTLTVVRGNGTKAELSGGTVGGKAAAVTWDGGRPLPLGGQGSIDLNGPVDVELTTGGASWKLDGPSRVLTPGSYSLGATVAVSPLNGGLATPKDGIRLEVPPGAPASLKTRGDVRVATPPAPLSLKGPGQLVLEGSLQVMTRDGKRQAAKVTFGPGAFELNLQPEADGYHVEQALLQGPMTVDG